MRFVCRTCIRQSPEDPKPLPDCANCNLPEIELQNIKDNRDCESNATQIWEKKKNENEHPRSWNVRDQ